jgi:hypothetical protein
MKASGKFILVKDYGNIYKHKDIQVIVEYAGKKVGFFSKGEPKEGQPNRLLNKLKELVDDGCEVIICATRTSGATAENVKDMMQPPYGYNVIWSQHFNMEQTENQDAAISTANGIYADAVIALVCAQLV